MILDPGVFAAFLIFIAGCGRKDDYGCFLDAFPGFTLGRRFARTTFLKRFQILFKANPIAKPKKRRPL